MNKGVKAALLSAFVFPGAGHLLLKRYISGGLLALFSLTITYFQMSEMMANMSSLMSDIQRGVVIPDISTMTTLLIPSANSSVTSILLVIWLLAAIDAYRLGRKQP